MCKLYWNKLQRASSLQRTLGRGEDERKHLADNFANLAEKMSAVADQIKTNQNISKKIMVIQLILNQLLTL